jgi:uncharacterized protein with NRDE domain
VCLILVAWQMQPGYPLVMAANRDEYFRRPTRAAHYWDDAPGVLGGRDLEAGGSWLGVDAAGRVAAVTNYREPPRARAGELSRGLLVSDFLKGELAAADYLRETIRWKRRYDAFNLLLADVTGLYFYSSREPDYRELAPGCYGISNGELDCPWPKVNKGKQILRQQLDSGHVPDSEALFDLLADAAPAADRELPDTGVGLETERKLSPIFINLDGYGTRSSTVLITDAQGKVFFAERNFDATGKVQDTGRFEFSSKSS